MTSKCHDIEKTYILSSDHREKSTEREIQGITKTGATLIAKSCQCDVVCSVPHHSTQKVFQLFLTGLMLLTLHGFANTVAIKL